jgi:hypothetical protein
MRYHPVVASLLVGGLLVTSSPVNASVAGRKNTAIGATGLAVYQLARGHTGTGLLAAAGAGYAWHQYNRAHKRSNRRSAFEAGYRAGVRRSYQHLRTQSRRR